MICISQISGDIQNFTSIAVILSSWSDYFDTMYIGMIKDPIDSFPQVSSCNNQTKI